MEEDHLDVVMIETDHPGRHLNVISTRPVAESRSGLRPVHKGAAYRDAVKTSLDHLRTRWAESRAGLFEVRLNEHATFLVRQEGARYHLQLPSVGWVKCWNRNQVERLCLDYCENPPPEEEEDANDAEGIPSPAYLRRMHHSRVL
jgi:hypothetical protein